MSGDSSAEMTVEEHDQTAIAASPEVPTAPAEDPAQESVARADPSDEQTALSETNGHPETNGHGPGAEGSADAPEQPAADRPPLPVTPDVEKPAFGPRILGVAEPVKPLPSKKAAAPVRKRRRRPSAAERHRRAFFAALTELRRGTSDGEAEPAAATESVPAEAVETPAAPEAVPETPAEPEAVQPEAPAEPEAVQPATPAEPKAVQPEAPAEPEAVQPETPAEPEAVQPETPAAPEALATAAQPDSSPAHLTVAIERVGGPEVIKEALKPKQDEKGQPLKWAAVCAQAAEGLKPGDPVFNAWVRLAATPVREVKGHLPRPAEQARPAGREGGARRGGAQRSGDGGGRRDRPRRDGPNRQEFASHAQDGTLRKSIRIVTGHDEDQERRERERVRKEQREAKRRAERERLARLGY